MKAYLDNNILIDIEEGNLTKEDLVKKVQPEIKTFFYSFLHLFEADEITGTKTEREDRLQSRFKVITEITENNYLHYDLENHTMHEENYEPEPLFRNVEKTDTKYIVKNIANSISKEERATVKEAFAVNPIHLNNFTPEEVLSELNKKKEMFKGRAITEIIKDEKEKSYPGKEFKLYEDILATIEILDLIGYWKDKYSIKSNYARTLDGMHIFFSTYCDYFISDDTRTRNKAKVIFKLFDIPTKVVSSTGN